jgi:hypothetical protein
MHLTFHRERAEFPENVRNSLHEKELAPQEDSATKISSPSVTSPGHPSVRLMSALRRYVIVGLNTLDCPRSPDSRRACQSFQCRFKSSQRFRARIGKDFPDFGCVFAGHRLFTKKLMDQGNRD